jgi:hypothetical protein
MVEYPDPVHGTYDPKRGGKFSRRKVTQAVHDHWTWDHGNKSWTQSHSTTGADPAGSLNPRKAKPDPRDRTAAKLRSMPAESPTEEQARHQEMAAEQREKMSAQAQAKPGATDPLKARSPATAMGSTPKTGLSPEEQGQVETRLAQQKRNIAPPPIKTSTRTIPTPSTQAPASSWDNLVSALKQKR